MEISPLIQYRLDSPYQFYAIVELFRTRRHNEPRRTVVQALRASRYRVEVSHEKIPFGFDCGWKRHIRYTAHCSYPCKGESLAATAGSVLAVVLCALHLKRDVIHRHLIVPSNGAYL